MDRAVGLHQLCVAAGRALLITRGIAAEEIDQLIDTLQHKPHREICPRGHHPQQFRQRRTEQQQHRDHAEDHQRQHKIQPPDLTRHIRLPRTAPVDQPPQHELIAQQEESPRLHAGQHKNQRHRHRHPRDAHEKRRTRCQREEGTVAGRAEERVRLLVRGHRKEDERHARSKHRGRDPARHAVNRICCTACRREQHQPCHEPAAPGVNRAEMQPPDPRPDCGHIGSEQQDARCRKEHFCALLPDRQQQHPHRKPHQAAKHHRRRRKPPLRTLRIHTVHLDSHAN